MITFLLNQSILFWLNFLKLKTQNKKKIQKKQTNAYDTATELYIDWLGTNLDECNELSDDKRIKWILNKILKKCFLKNMIIVCDQKMT